MYMILFLCCVRACAACAFQLVGRVAYVCVSIELARYCTLFGNFWNVVDKGYVFFRGFA